jgi:hypothetical protein
MTGIVIAFPKNRAGARAKNVHPSRRKQPSQIRVRVDRIALLLAELDNLVPLSGEVSAVLTQALATVSQMEEKLAERSWGPSALGAEEDGDSQPHVDPDVLERHFHSLVR